MNLVASATIGGLCHAAERPVRQAPTTPYLEPSMPIRIPYDELEREFDRIDADDDVRNGFASSDPRVTMGLVLTALRATPTDGGTAAFERTLDAMLKSLGDPGATPGRRTPNPR